MRTTLSLKIITAAAVSAVLLAPQAASAAAKTPAVTSPAVSRQARATVSPTLVNAIIDDRGPIGTAFSNTSVWRQNISTAPLNSNSAALVSNLSAQVATYYGGTAATNITQYNTSIYTVSADQAKVNVNWDNCQKKAYTPKGLLGDGGQFSAVPIPDTAVPATGTDAQLTVYSPQTDQLWEFWKAKKVNGAWQACWGGRIDNVSTSYGYFSNGFGASASGLAVSAGSVGIREAQAGHVDHALSLAIPDIMNYKTFSWPAQRSDGNSMDPNAIPAGMRLRLDPSVNVDALNLHPIAKMIAKAAQNYGFIVTDKSGAVAVSTESGAAVKADTGVDPWDALRTVNGKMTPTYLIMKNFPWDKMQAMPVDFGKPVS
ncbi:MAG: hypothetical protein ACRYF3_01675 [Janthinobacterium lividum]